MAFSRTTNQRRAHAIEIAAMSHAAIAAVLARDDLSTGERLVAWSLASFANREQLAWPGTPAAAARAGLSRSRYLDAREQLVRRGLLEVEKGVGRGQSSIVGIRFAQPGPWWEGEVNVALVEAVLAYGRQRGPARVLLAALAALADRDGVAEGLTTAELCRVSGLANSTYRRARSALLSSGEVQVDDAGGGRGRTCRWCVHRPANIAAEPRVEPSRRSVAKGSNSRPLMTIAREESALVENGPILSGVPAEKGPIAVGVCARKRPILSEVSGGKGPRLTSIGAGQASAWLRCWCGVESGPDRALSVLVGVVQRGGAG